VYRQRMITFQTMVKNPGLLRHNKGLYFLLEWCSLLRGSGSTEQRPLAMNLSKLSHKLHYEPGLTKARVADNPKKNQNYFRIK
jgi:hypothetical protein